jgi:hypothetical protein
MYKPLTDTQIPKSLVSILSTAPTIFVPIEDDYDKITYEGLIDNKYQFTPEQQIRILIWLGTIPKQELPAYVDTHLEKWYTTVNEHQVRLEENAIRMAEIQQGMDALQERVGIVDGSCEARYDQLLEQDSLMNEDIRQLKEIVVSLPEAGAVVFDDYKSLLLAMKDNPSKDMFKLGQTIYIVTPDVPDLWVGAILDENTGIDDDIVSLDTEVVDGAVIELINAINALEVGWYKFFPHEAKTKVEGVNRNIEDGRESGSVQQVADGVADGFDFTGKNPNATALDTTLTGIIPYGARGNFSTAFGGKSSAQGKRSNAEGTTTVAKGDYSHTEGNATVTLGANAHAEGAITVAKGGTSHAEGQRTQALGEASHSEGVETKAMLKGSHAEGYGTVAGENYAHAEGYACEALHEESHAEGYYTKTGKPFQHVSGAYNEGNSDTILEVGNGNSTKRQNAFEIKDDNSISIIFNGEKVSLQELLGRVANGGGGGLYLNTVSCYCDGDTGYFNFQIYSTKPLKPEDLTTYAGMEFTGKISVEDYTNNNVYSGIVMVNVIPFGAGETMFSLTGFGNSGGSVIAISKMEVLTSDKISVHSKEV